MANYTDKNLNVRYIEHECENFKCEHCKKCSHRLFIADMLYVYYDSIGCDECDCGSCNMCDKNVNDCDCPNCDVCKKVLCVCGGCVSCYENNIGRGCRCFVECDDCHEIPCECDGV